MKARMTYDVDLREVDCVEYAKNPVVLADWHHDLGHVIGRARILSGNRRVEVTFYEGPPTGEHKLMQATEAGKYSEPVLIGLALVPIRSAA